MNNRDDFESRWKRWSEADPAVDEHQLRNNLLARIPECEPRVRAPFVLAVAAASLVAAVIGIETMREPAVPLVTERSEMVYETADNVILVVREGSEPIYVVTGRSTREAGE